MKIWLQKHVVQGRLPVLDEWYLQHIAAVVNPGTEVMIRTLPRRTYESEIPYDYVAYGVIALRFNQYFAESALFAEREGYDAWVIAAGQDPGLNQARAMANIPTLGYGFIPALQEPITENIHRYGTSRWFSSYGLIPGGKPAVMAAIEGKADQFMDEAAKAAEHAASLGAQVIIPAEGLPAEVLWHYGIKELAGLPVLDPLGLLLKSAENEVQMRALGCLARPKRGFWFAQPDREILDHVESVFPLNRIEQED